MTHSSPFTEENIIKLANAANARAMHPDWARSLRDQCKAAEVSFFSKQMAKKAPIPDDLMVMQYPGDM